MKLTRIWMLIALAALMAAACTVAAAAAEPMEYELRFGKPNTPCWRLRSARAG